MKSSKLLFVASVAIMLPPLSATVWAGGAHDKHHVDGKAAVNTADMADGEVRKVDKDAKKITLKHGEIRSLDMPPMTMVFQVKDTALLDKVKAGDKVKFKAEKVTSGYAVSEMELAK